MARWRGFTLAELLIALAILGVIAMFTVPKVLTYQADQKRNSIFKEAFASVSDLQQKAQYDGVSIPTGFVDYLIANLNYARNQRNSASNGDFWLHNGARININVGGRMDVLVDWNGSLGSNTLGDDQLKVFFIFQSGGGCSSTLGRWVPHSPSCTSGTNPAENLALYESVFSAN